MSKVFLTAGLGFGDEGKGSVVDKICRQEQVPLVARYNGGAQAAHHVVCDDGRQHCFSQFGSGTFAGARTFLSRYMLFNPYTLLSEAEGLERVGVKDPLSLVTIEKTTLLTSPFHMAANRVREILRGDGRHGSCGMGIGETVASALEHPSEALMVVDITQDSVRSRARLNDYRRRIVEALAPSFTRFMAGRTGDLAPTLIMEWEILIDGEFVDAVIEKYCEVLSKIEVVDASWLHQQLNAGPVVFEGAQGVLLDQDYGFHPHTTWSDCTFGNAEKLLAGTGVLPTRIGVTRGYMTRHGAGPLITEDPSLTAPGEHNGDSPWQKNFRLGHFDPILLRYALKAIGGVDQLALTCLDHLKGDIKSCTKYTTRVGEKRALRGLNVSLKDEIPCPARPTLHQQEEMGYILQHFLRPVYETLPDVESFIMHVEKELGFPVGLTSFGPKASDKRTRAI